MAHRLRPVGLVPSGTGTREQMTFALDGTALLRTVCRWAGPGVGRALREATRTPERRLLGSASSEPGLNRHAACGREQPAPGRSRTSHPGHTPVASKDSIAAA